jgi:hypothetical protein
MIPTVRRRLQVNYGIAMIALAIIHKSTASGTNVRIPIRM